MVQDTSGDVIFRVQFRAIACRPEVNEVLDGRVLEVTSTGIIVQSGPIKTFISMKVNFFGKTLLSNSIFSTYLQNRGTEYVYETQSNQWQPKENDKIDGVLEKGVHVRYRITSRKYLNNNDFVSAHRGKAQIYIGSYSFLVLCRVWWATSTRTTSASHRPLPTEQS